MPPAPATAPVQAERQGPYSPAYTRYVLFIALLVMVFNNLDRTILGILVEPIKRDLSMSDTQMGAAMGVAFTLVYSLLALPVARWADHGVRRSIVAIGLLCWSGFTAATAMVQSFTQLFLMRMGVGIGESAGTAPTLSLLSDYVPPRQRGRGLSVVSLGAITGMGLGMMIGGLINEVWGWRAAFVVAGLPGMGLALLLRLTVAEPPRGASETGRSAESGTTWEAVRYLFGTPTYRFILIANSFSLFAAMGRNLWEPSFIIRIYDMGTFWAGSWYFLTSPLPSMLGIFLGGYFADRLAPRDQRWYLWVAAIGQAISVPILLAFLLWPETHRVSLIFFDVPFAFVLSFVGSVFGSWFTAPFLATIQGIAKLRMRAFAAAISTLVTSFVGLLAGPLLVGMLSDAFAARFAEEALRYSLLVPTAAPLLSALVCLIGASSVPRDLARAREQDA
ncbi:MAG: MFS transporter [Proteobacteria bacterium]|nr:MFS transporter [Pseudomonadota bacterium]